MTADFDKRWNQEMKDMRDDLWKAKIRLAISESRDAYGVIDPVQLEKYLEMAIGEDDE